MHTSAYDALYILGQGYTPVACAKLLLDRGIKSTFLEYNQKISSFSQKRLQAAGISHMTADAKKLSTFFPGTEKTLILSVNNTFIFPQKLVESENIDIINYHNSLLPRHRGVHAEAWSIYDGDQVTGITWHRVNSGIDTGDILCQAEILLNDTMTSISLLNKQSKLAVNTLNIFLDDILQNRIFATQQPVAEQSHIHLKKDIPNNGELCLDWPPATIWNFLRAMDYGMLYTLGMPKVSFHGAWYGWKKYARLEKTSRTHEKIRLRNNSLIIGGTFVLDQIFEL